MNVLLHALIPSDAALQAHARAGAGHRYLGVTRPDADETQRPMIARRMSGHECAACGTTDAAQFPPKYRSLCRTCLYARDAAKQAKRRAARGAKPRAPSMHERALAALARGPLDTRHLRQALGCSATGLYALMKRAKKRGTIICVRPTYSNQPAVWALATQETKR